MNVLDVITKFPNQETCIKFLEELRWGDKPKCNFCSSKETFPITKELRHHCKKCNKSFSVTAGTVFHRTRVPIQKWFLLIVLMTNAKKGLSSCQAARDIDLKQKIVWKMMHKLRERMTIEEMQVLSGTLEMDETYVGGKPRKSNDIENTLNSSKRGRGTNKECVAGIVERNGNVKAIHVKDHSTKAKDLEKIVKDNVDINNSTLITDEYRAYSRMSNILPHQQVNHQKWFSYNGIHTNTIESFWAIVKRGMMGQFHWVSKKWLQFYLNEFCFKYNNRKKPSMFKILLVKCLLKVVSIYPTKG